jgi:hypothetical protein
VPRFAQHPRKNTMCAEKRTTRSQANLHTDLWGCAARGREDSRGKNFADLGSVDSTRISGTLLSPRLNHYGSVEVARPSVRDSANYLRLEPVAHSRFGDEVARPSWIIFELMPERLEVLTQIVGLFDVCRAPDLLQQLPLADQPPGMPNQCLE